MLYLRVWYSVYLLSYYTSTNTDAGAPQKALRRKARQNQMYFRHLHEYAASLTGTLLRLY